MIFIIVFYFRMLGLPKSLRERDNPPAPSDLDQDQETSKKLEEAMEDNLSTETQVSQEEEEGQAENTADPPRTRYADIVKLV